MLSLFRINGWASSAASHLSRQLRQDRRLFHNTYSTFEAGINFTLPILTAQLKADNAQALFNQRQQKRYRQEQTPIFVGVTFAHNHAKRTAHRRQPPEEARLRGRSKL